MAVIVGTLIRHVKWSRTSRGQANCNFMVLAGTEKIFCSIYGPDADHLYKEIKCGEEVTIEGSYPQKQKTRGPKIFNAKSLSTKYYRSWSELIHANYGSVASYRRARKYIKRVEQLRPKAYEVERIGDRDRDEGQMTQDQYSKIRFYNTEVDKRTLTDAECRDLINELTNSIKMQDKLRQRVEMWKTIAGSLEKRVPDIDGGTDNDYE